MPTYKIPDNLYANIYIVSIDTFIFKT